LTIQFAVYSLLSACEKARRVPRDELPRRKKTTDVVCPSPDIRRAMGFVQTRSLFEILNCMRETETKKTAEKPGQKSRKTAASDLERGG
jgi:hypothetical protein